MKTLITDEHARVSRWVNQRLGIDGDWQSTCSTLGLEQDGELIAGAVIDGYVPDTRCTLHCAAIGKTWLNRRALFAIFDYVFNQLKVKVVLDTVSSSNEASLRFTKHLGFTEVCRIANAAPDGDLVIFTLRREDCRWLDMVVR